jgi:hypothetical protein
MIISEAGGRSVYGNLLPTVLSVCKSPEWWLDTGANVHVCADISLFSSYQAGVTGSVLMGNRSHARVLGVGTVNLKFTSGKTVLLKHVQHVPLSKRIFALFAWLISHQPAVLFSHNKPATSNQPAVLFSQNKPAPAISHQPTEQAAC